MSKIKEYLQDIKINDIERTLSNVDDNTLRRRNGSLVKVSTKIIEASGLQVVKPVDESEFKIKRVYKGRKRKKFDWAKNFIKSVESWRRSNRIEYKARQESMRESVL